MPALYEYIILYVVMRNAYRNHCNEKWRRNAMVDWKEEIATTLKSEAAKLPPNSRFYPIRKMMVRFNTSQRTIEQVMEKLVAENVMVRHPGDGYFTRNQSPNRQLHYRLVYPKWPSELFKRLETLWSDHARKTGQFRFSSRMHEQTEEFFRALPTDDCDALFVVPPSEPISLNGLRYLCSLPFPVVIINHEIAGISLSSVTENAAAGGAIAAAHLINHGHRRLAMLITEPHNDGIDMRCQGFADFARLNGISVEVLDTHTESWSHIPCSAYNCLAEHLRKRGLTFSGLFIISAFKALEVYKVFKDFGISIPGDVSIVAHDELAANELMTPPLDTIMHDDQEAIEQVHGEIIRMLRGEQNSFHIRIMPKLIKRQSVRTITATRQDASTREEIS